MKIKKGDVVTRKSYDKDILFYINRIIRLKNNKHIAILKGLTVRIEADAPVEDLEKVAKDRIISAEETINLKLMQRFKQKIENRNYVIKTGRILHLDGDRRYSEKAIRYYKKMGLDAIVKNIAENKQPLVVRTLLEKYKPDILVITGHDAMLKKDRNYNNIYNYRNSKYFINTVKEARKWASKSDTLVIFAGACQSFFEAIIEAGADFASSPGRILIDFVDPLIVAEKIAITDRCKFITSYEISKEIREGERGISGIGARGKKTTQCM